MRAGHGCHFIFRDPLPCKLFRFLLVRLILFSVLTAENTMVFDSVIRRPGDRSAGHAKAELRRGADANAPSIQAAPRDAVRLLTSPSGSVLFFCRALFGLRELPFSGRLKGVALDAGGQFLLALPAHLVPVQQFHDPLAGQPPGRAGQQQRADQAQLDLQVHSALAFREPVPAGGQAFEPPEPSGARQPALSAARRAGAAARCLTRKIRRRTCRL